MNVSRLEKKDYIVALFFTLPSLVTYATEDPINFFPSWYLTSSGENTTSKCVDSKGSVLIDEKLASLAARAELANQISTSLKTKTELFLSESTKSGEDKQSNEQIKMVMDMVSNTDLVGSVITKKGMGKSNGKDIFCAEAMISAENLYKTLENTARKNNIATTPELIQNLKITAQIMTRE